MSRKTRKLIWSAPLVAVLAVAGALAIFAALQPGWLSADELTDAPMNLKVAAADGNDGRTALVLTWDAPATGATTTGYRIDVSMDNDKYKYLAMTDVNTRTYTHSGIKGSTSGVKRFYRVFAMNSHQSGAVSTWESGTTKKITVPGEVVFPDPTSNDPTKIELTWTAPENGGADILGYCILAFGPADTNQTPGTVTDANCLDMLQSEGPGTSNAGTGDDTGDVIRIAPATAYTHDKLRAEQAWNYRVYAVNEHGHSMTASDRRNAETPSANDPSSPGNLLVLQNAGTGNASEVIQLFWTAPDDGGQNVLRYRVEVSDKSTYWPSATAPAPEDATNRAIVDDLAPDTGDPADDKANVVIVYVAAEAATAADVEVGYNLQHTVNVAEDTTLHYRVRTETDADGEVDTTGDRKMSSYRAGSIDVVEMTANDIDSETDGVQPGYTPPVLQPELRADPPADETPGQIDIAIITNPANSYRVDVSDDGAKTWEMVHFATRPISPSTYEHEGLKPNKDLTLRLFGKEGSDYGVASEPEEDTSGHSKAPEPAKPLTATAQGAGRIMVSWSEPASNNGSDIAKYCVVANRVNDALVIQGTPATRATIDTTGAIAAMSCTKLGDPATSPFTLSANRVVQVAPSETSFVFKGLEEKTRWQFQVYALNDATDPDPDGDGTDNDDDLDGVALTSATVSAKTGSAVVPMMPQNLTAELARDTNASGFASRGVLLMWNAPADPEGSKVTGYKIERKINDGEYSIRVENMPANKTFWPDSTELGTNMHTYRVTSRNGVGPGTEMAVVMIPYPMAGHSHAAVPSDLGMASNLRIGLNSGGTIQVTWDAADNAVGYIVIAIDRSDFSATSAPVNPDSAGVTQTTLNLGGLTVGTDYYVYVAATGSAGDNTLSIPPLEVTAQ